MAYKPKLKTLPDPVLAELTMIRKLLVFGLLKSGHSQKHVAAALGMSQSSISRMFSENAPRSGVEQVTE